MNRSLPSARACGSWSGAPMERLRPLQEVGPGRVGDHSLSYEEFVIEAFFEAWRAEDAVEVRYHGGSTPGARRSFRPASLYRLHPGGPLYATGYCELRKAERTLRLDRARLVDGSDGWRFRGTI